jgi:RecA-family ATPase
LTALHDGNPVETAWVDHIISLAEAHAHAAQAKVGLIVIDHARLVMGGDPISSDHVTALLRALNRIAVSTGAAVLLLAHSPKSTIGKDSEADAAEVFGSGAFVDHSRAAFVMNTMRPSEAKGFGLTEKERKDYVGLTAVKANYGPAQKWWLRKEFIEHWQVVELVPDFPLAKSQLQSQSALTRKIMDMVKAEPGKLTRRALRDRSGVKRSLGASERDVTEALQRALEEGALVLREPTDLERKKHKLSANVREVLDLP